MASLCNLPPPLLLQILLYLSNDHVSVCRTACTCQDLKTVADETSLWEALHQHRWQTRQLPRNSDADFYSKANYQRRNEVDRNAVACIKACSVIGAALGHLTAAYHQVLVHSKHDALEVCWKVADENKEKNPHTYRMALSMGRMIQCSYLADQVMEMKGLAETMDPRTLVEEYAILVSSLFFARPPFEAKAASSRQQLDDIATTIHARLPQSASVEQKVNAVNLVLFDEMLFSGNSDNYYDHRNSLLHEALKHKTAIPMTLAVIYQSVARRLGVDVDIIGLPGHIVVGIPALGRYINVFAKGRILSRQACVSIVNSYGIVMRDDFLQPLVAIDVLCRICNNLVRCTTRSGGGQLQALAVQSIHGAASSLVSRPGSEDIVIVNCWALSMTRNPDANVYW